MAQNTSYTVTDGTNTAILFATKSYGNVGVTPSQVVLSDVTGDGFQDALVAVTGSDRVAVLFNSGTGTYTSGPNVNLTAGSGPSSIATGKFDANGTVDFAVTDLTTNNVQTFFGNGAGAFTP